MTVELGKKKNLPGKMPENPTFSSADTQQFSAVIMIAPRFWIYPTASILYLLSTYSGHLDGKWVGVRSLCTQRMTKIRY